MVSEADIVSAVKRLRERVKSEVRIERVLLFGSRGRGEARTDSDVDLLVVSPSFAGRTVAWRAFPLRRAWDLDAAVDFVCYTPEEFSALAARSSLARTALTEGRDLVG